MKRAMTLALFATLSATAAAAPWRDDFSDANSGWPNRAATSNRDLGFAVYTDTGKYQLTPVQDGVFGFVAAPKQAAGGVRMRATMFLYAGIGAGAAGLACRFQDHDNFYAFVARGDATLAIVKVQGGRSTVLAEGPTKSIIPGAVDTVLTASCKGDTLSLESKGDRGLRARDATFAKGESGLVVAGEKLAGTSVTFDDFELSTD